MRRVMCARAADEANRTVTPLELLFDLTFVAAIAQLAARLAHATVGGQTLSSLGPFLMVFFAIWWAWMNFTWFASAYDCDDGPYRLAAFVQMGGVLVLAAGTGPAFDDGDFTAVTIGYLIMRIGLLSLWTRAAIEHPRSRGTSVRYAGGVAGVEVLWIGRLALGDRAGLAAFLLLVGLELTVPIWAEHRGATTWHPHHIAERYGLFTIILLGESVFAATTAVVAVVQQSAGPGLVAVSASSLVIVAALWWLYFAVPAGSGLEARRDWSFLWGYGHYVPFAALAALGAGLEVAVLGSVGHGGHLDDRVVVAAVALPVAVVVVMLELLRVPGGDPRVGPTTLIVLVLIAAIVATAEELGSVAGVALVALTVTAAAVTDSTAVNPSRSRT